MSGELCSDRVNILSKSAPSLECLIGLYVHSLEIQI
jgi:hypothetical protein